MAARPMQQQPITRPLPRIRNAARAHLPPLMVDAQGVTRAFSDDAGVFDLSFEVPTGTIFGLIGPSGSGKTTTVRLMTGLYRPDSGSMRVLGREPAKFSSRTRERIGYMPQQFV